MSGVGAQEHPASPPQPNSVIAQAQSFLAAGNPAAAIQVLSSHLQAHSKDASARLLLAEAYILARQTDQAEEQYQAILKLAPDNYRALAGFAELYEREGNPEKAEPMLARAATLSRGAPKIKTAWAAVLARLHRYKDASHALAGVSPPSLPEERISFHRLKASIAAGLGDAGTAASEMEKALALSPDQAGLQMATAAAEMQAKNWQRAASLAGPLFARNRDPGLGLVLLEAQLGSGDDIRPTLEALRRVTLPEQQETVFRQRLAELLISHERFFESVDELKRALELEPARADLKFNLALAQFKSHQLDDALATAASLQKTADSAELESLIGDIQEARGDNLAAVRSYQAAVTLAPNEEKYRLELALDLIQHKSFEPARVVLKQAEELHPDSWRVRVASGMVEYFAGSAEDATKTLLKAADVAAEPEAALRYLGDIQMDQAGAPDRAALSRLCEYGDAHPNAGKLQFYCAALLFRRDYLSNDRSHTGEILRRLNAAARKLPNEASPHCQLGKAYRWIEQWQEALRESETCARMDSNSADAHYRLAQIYQHLGQQERSEQEMKLYQAASARLADENARRDETIKTFLYSIQNETKDRK
jgi:Flp pilus assembly protein TadD